ncbi:13509_t:CDS:1 [Funneliformis mosseae]|uniref:13509_t:CDS:1 n=1 Tax=Funneliformis mosseae TaxID=27381 RepID=A0A9N8VGT6_FUNMO|nr:13509_t:CDS:1 [Funneliformis mosseae]
MTKGFENELKDNSKHIREMMKQQNEHIQTSITIAEKTLNILSLTDFIDIIVDELTQECWNRVNLAFNDKIRKNKIDFGRAYASEIPRFREFLVKYDITIEEFELLMRFKRKSNVEFHNDDDAKKLIESIPEISKEFKVPLIKVLNALE